MKRLLALSLLIFTFFTATAQKTQIDSLRLVLSQAKTDTTRFEALRSLDNAYYLSKPDSSILFGQECYLLAKKNNWVLNQLKSCNNLASDYSYLGDYVKAMSFFFKALKIAGELNDLSPMSTVNDDIGVC